MSSGVTPWLRPPSAVARFVDTLVRMPASRASFDTPFMPISFATCTYTALSEKVVARASVCDPAYASS